MIDALDKWQARRDGPTLTGFDARADGGQRQITLRKQGVLISRQREGVRMNIGVPAQSYHGVAVNVAAGDGGSRFRIVLMHRDADLAVVLDETTDRRVALAHLQYWGLYFDLPLYIERKAGALERVEHRTGDVVCGGARNSRRKRRTIAKRRGHFLCARKPGQTERLAHVFSGEDEIIARN